VNRLSAGKIPIDLPLECCRIETEFEKVRRQRDARGLMSEPKLLLLDEPSLGLAPLVVDSIFGIVKNLRASGIPILLVEQNVAAALTIADRAYIMETGKIVTHGSAAQLRGDDEVRRRYLGM
jgi:branched-chain amino acid transport system ATP-binding protein